MDLNFATDEDLRELSAEEAWETIENFAQGQKEWDKPFKAITEQELAILKAQANELCGNEKVSFEILRFISWDKVDNPSPQSTLQVLPSFEETKEEPTHPSNHWREAMADELNSISKNNVWELAELPKDLGEASYVIGIEIHRDRADAGLGLSQKDYIERILNRFNMQHCSPTVDPVIKGDVFGSHQCLKTEVKYEEMRRIPYASVVGSLTYAQVCIRLDIAYICSILGRFQSNLGLLH
ncbi:hypothetical protein Tco_1476037 [Tanacetum coccineum]